MSNGSQLCQSALDLFLGSLDVLVDVKTHALAFQWCSFELERACLCKFVLLVLQKQKPILLLACHQTKVTMLANRVEQTIFLFLSSLFISLFVFRYCAEAVEMKTSSTKIAIKAILAFLLCQIPTKHLQEKGYLEILHAHLIESQHLTQQEGIGSNKRKYGFAIKQRIACEGSLAQIHLSCDVIHCQVEFFLANQHRLFVCVYAMLFVLFYSLQDASRSTLKLLCKFDASQTDVALQHSASHWSKAHGSQQIRVQFCVRRVCPERQLVSSSQGEHSLQFM